MSNKFSRLIEISYALLETKRELRCFHTTFIIKKGKIVAIGWNKTKTHTRNLKLDYRDKNGNDIRNFVGLHSENAAVIKYGQDDCSDCDFVNIRINRNGDIASSRPCQGCLSLVNQLGYKRFFYTNNQGQFESLD